MSERQRALADVILNDPDVESLTSFVGVDGTNPTLNSGRMLINLKDQRGLALMHKLTDEADVFVENYLLMQERELAEFTANADASEDEASSAPLAGRDRDTAAGRAVAESRRLIDMLDDGDGEPLVQSLDRAVGPVTVRAGATLDLRVPAALVLRS